ncbi:hypothetical protein N7510_009918 [Penicillium lagena]|uniref:uncharacterized protein n=1 Tax=Penicillium lagena TaxID=94218 RepID=UPI0025425D3B|nr:uncharacterized protein N7510_009918 [Penicillium lagena]KAJ5604764.1 hypothetical protein N7510_009918 [Penicillium lagena]
MQDLSHQMHAPDTSPGASSTLRPSEQASKRVHSLWVLNNGCQPTQGTPLPAPSGFAVSGVSSRWSGLHFYQHLIATL